MGLTPMMQQYLEMHEQAPDAILMFRLGDFYEMFFDDAVLASKELEIALTGRDCGLDERAPMCGVPHHAADSYIARLVEKGHKVAICEQMEDPALAKGIVKREIIRIVSPGTVTDSSVLDPGSNNYLMCISAGRTGQKVQETGCAVLDLSTGAFMVSEYDGNDRTGWLQDECARFSPSEILLHSALYEDEKLPKRLEQVSSAFVEPFPSRRYAKGEAEQLLKEQFGVYSVGALGLGDHPEAVRAAGALLSYIRETQKTDISHITRIGYLEEDEVMALDAASRINLELTKTIRGGRKAGSLLSVLDLTKTAAGSRLLKNWLEAPLISKKAITARQDRIRELYSDPRGLTELRAAISKIYDLERICSKAGTTGANTTDLISLKISAAALEEVAGILAGLDMPLLGADFDRLDMLTDLKELIEQAVWESDGEVRRFSAEPKIKKGWNAELDEIRELSENGKDYLMQIEANERERTGISNLKVKYNKVFGYFIEVSNGKKDLVPDDYIRKQTLVNAERYFTEELKETENRITDAESRLGIVEAKLFQEVQETVRQAAPRIQQAARQAAELDVFASLAQRALDSSYVCPEIGDDGAIQIKGGRHPVVEQMTGRAHFISNDTDIDRENRLMLLTGPNMAGKSTYIRQTALIVLMAQIGSFVPADSARIGICDRIFTRVGASDDLGTGQSTFMVEMTEVSNILRGATEDSLVILDEIGRGTSTFDGISIAWAICEELLERGVKTMFATHYHELTELEELHPGIVNYSIAVKETAGGVLFLRKIRRGAADQSYGIEVAKLAGFPKKVTDRAEQILAGLEENPVENPHGIVPPEPAQISFLTPQEPQKDSSRTALKMLASASPDDMTPREAHDFVYELVRLVQEEE